MKKIAILLTALLLLTLVGCGDKSGGESSSPDQTFTGVLDEKKDFMITVVSEDGGDAYVFGIDGISVDAQVGDTVTVTYTGDPIDGATATEVTLAE